MRITCCDSTRAPPRIREWPPPIVECARTISMTIARPSPAPSLRTLAAPETVEDARPIIGGIPCPLSKTLTVPSLPTSTITSVPGAVCASAFSIRLRSASAIASAFPVIGAGCSVPVSAIERPVAKAGCEIFGRTPVSMLDIQARRPRLGQLQSVDAICPAKTGEINPA
jgi:hypothetical protein